MKRLCGLRPFATTERVYLPAVIAGIGILVLVIWAALPADFRCDQTWEEDAMFYRVGKNFVDSGFWKTKLLDDYAVGADPAAHPMLYTHFPTISGVLQGLIQMCHITRIRAIKLLFVPLFLVGMIYFYLSMKRLFTARIALVALAVTGSNYLGTLAWADSTVHSLHWIFLFAVLYHYLSIPTGDSEGVFPRLHLSIAWFFLFLAGSLTYMHILFLLISIGLLFLTNIHRVRLRHLVLLLSAPVALFVLHQLRVISLLGIDAWFFDQAANIGKAANIVGYDGLRDFYNRHGIVLWPSDFHSLSARQAFTIFWNGLLKKEGLSGVLVLLGLIAAAFSHLLFPSAKSIVRIDRLGGKVLILFLASVAWDFLFPVHASNYFNATPYILLAGMTNLAWALLFVAITSRACLEKARGRPRTYGVLLLCCFAIFSYQRVDSYLMNPITRVPGTEILQEYQGAKFYSNIWPLFVSYYTKEWTVGGLDPSQAVERKPENAKYFLQKDKANHKKYARSDYYLYVFPEKVAPFAEPRFRQVLDSSLPVVECGDNWCIYDMRRASGSSSAGTDP